MKVGATRKGASRGAAWLSSARVVRCWVKSRNERNPYPVLPSNRISQETAADNVEEGGDDVKSSWPLCPGLHTYYNGIDRGQQYRKVEPIPKLCPSSDCGLQFAHMKPAHEAGISSNRRSARCGEYVPGSCTHRPSHHESQWQQKYQGRPGPKL